MIYVISQIFVIISYMVLSFSYFNNDKKKILVMSCAAVVCNAVAFALLGAWSGFFMSLVAIIRNCFFLISGKKEKNNWISLMFFFIIMAFLAFFTYEGIFSLFSMFGTMIYTYSAWQKSPRVYKILGIPTSICWIIYNIYVISIFGAVLESALLIFEIMGVKQDYNKKD